MSDRRVSSGSQKPKTTPGAKAPFTIKWKIIPFVWIDLCPVYFFGFRVSRQPTPALRRKESVALRHQRMRS